MLRDRVDALRTICVGRGIISISFAVVDFVVDFVVVVVVAFVVAFVVEDECEIIFRGRRRVSMGLDMAITSRYLS